MWWKTNKWKVLAPVLVIAVLAGAFWWGGGAPGMQGWTVQPDQSDTDPVQVPAQPPEQAPGQPGEGTLPPAGGARPGGTDKPMTADEKIAAAAALAGQGEKDPADVPQAPEGPDAPPDTDTPPETGTQTDTETDGGQDPYLTDPVPDGRPLPVEPQDAAVTDTAYTCTISISCVHILDHMDWLDQEKVELVPEDGWLLEPVEVTFYEGESVFNVLQRTCKQNKIHMEFANTPMYNSAYIEGIGNLYEFDCGELSGWQYKVNEWFPNYGCSRYALQDGDTICWEYTCDLGVDTGGYNAMD